MKKLAKQLAKQFWGFSIAAIGVLWILNVAGVIGFDIFFHGWWTLLIILPCTAHLIANPNWGSFSGIALGAVLLLQAQGYIGWSVFWKLCLAIIFIAFGIVLIFPRAAVRSVGIATTPEEVARLFPAMEGIS